MSRGVIDQLILLETVVIGLIPAGLAAKSMFDSYDIGQPLMEAVTGFGVAGFIG